MNGLQTLIATIISASQVSVGNFQARGIAAAAPNDAMLSELSQLAQLGCQIASGATPPIP